ncbi:MAG: response regulator [Chitinispirillaceae bacterium]
MVILSVDDSAAVRHFIQKAADVLGYGFLGAENGKAALDILENQVDQIGLILLDWIMPVMNGLDFLKQVKSDSQIKHIPVIMVTSEVSKNRMICAIEAGAKNYITKPFTQEQIMQKILDSLGLGL